MAAAYDTKVNGVQTFSASSPSTVSNTLTTGAISNGVLVVCIGFNNVFSTAISSVKNGATSLTAITGASGTSAAGNWALAWYYLKVAGSTAYTIDVELTNSAIQQAWVALASFSGIDQTTVYANGTSGNGTSATPSLAITNASGDIAVGGVYLSNDSGAPSVTTGTATFTTDRDGLIFGGAGAGLYSTSTNPTVQWGGGSNGNDYVAAGFSLKAASAGGGSPSMLRPSMLNGLGAGGPFFNNPLGKMAHRPKLVWGHRFAEAANGLMVPERMAA